MFRPFRLVRLFRYVVRFALDPNDPVASAYPRALPAYRQPGTLGTLGGSG